MMISREVNLSKEFEKVLGNDILDSMEQYIKNSVKEVASNNTSTSGTKELDEYIEKICYRVMSKVLGEVFKVSEKRSFERMLWYGGYNR